MLVSLRGSGLLRFAILLAAGLPAVLAAEPIHIWGATVTGKILDPEGSPVPEAEVVLSPSEENPAGLSRPGMRESKAVSDAAGVFTIPHASAGRFDLRVYHRDFLTRSGPVVEVPAVAARVDAGTLTLERGVVIEGRVTGPSGAPLAGAELDLDLVSDLGLEGIPFSPYMSRAKANSDGRFRFEGLHRGMRFDLRAQHAGLMPAVLRSVEAPTREPLRIELKPGRILAGQVKDLEGRPVPKAEIRLRADLTTSRGRSLGATDGEGRFRLTGIPAGVVELTVQAAGYASTRVPELRIPEESDVEGLEIALSRASVLEVQVLESDRRPFAGAAVTAYLRKSGISWRGGLGGQGPGCVTDAEGRCRLEGLDPGPYNVFAEAQPQRQTWVPAELAPGINRTDLVFPAGVRASGVVKDETGAPVAGAHLYLSAQGKGLFLEGVSLADGSFQFPVVPDGAYSLYGRAAGFIETTAPEPVQVAGQEVQGLTLQLASGATLTGRVLGLAPEELASVRINAQPENAQVVLVPSSRADREGRYRIPDLPSGDWKIAAEARGRGIEEPLQIAPGAREAVLNLRFPAGFTITGEVTADGAPLGRARVQASSRGVSVEVLAGPDGGFRIPNVPPGRCSVTATEPGGVGTSADVEVTGDQEVHLGFSTGGLRVRALAGGAPVTEAAVHLSGTLPHPGPRMTNAAGDAEIPRLASGTYTVSVLKEGFAPATMSVEVSSGAMAAVEITLQPAP